MNVRPIARIFIAIAIVTGVAAAAAPSPALSAPREIKYLALGDSVASGAELGDAGSYPRRLGERIVNETGRSIQYVNRARAGEQSAGVVSRQLDGLDKLKPDVVTLTVGANDFLVPAYDCLASSVDSTPGMSCDYPDPRVSLANLESNLRQILGRLVRETSATILVTTYYNPFPKGAECGSFLVDFATRQMNWSIKKVARELPDRVAVVDLAPVFQGHEGHEPAGWFMKGPLGITCTAIHPTAEGQTAIAAAAWGALAARLGT